MKIIKIPFSGGSLGKNVGCDKAPDAIVADMKTQFLNESGTKGAYTVETAAVDNANIAYTNDSIYHAIIQNDDFPIILGGDHSITYSCFKAFSQKFPHAGLLVFDAHPDLMADVKEPTHEGYLRSLIEEGILDKENVILIGIRNWDSEALSYLRSHKIKHYIMKEVFSEPISETADAVMAAARNFSALYVSIDIDVLDPAFAPGTGYLEPGGLSTRELLYIIQRLRFLKNLLAVDLVEVNPEKDVQHLTVRTASKIVLEFL